MIDDADLAALPEPLTPPDCDTRGMEWMPLYGDRLFASETWLLASSDGKVAALHLWWAAYRQTPAGSVPDNDRVLAQLAGFGMAIRAWQEVRQEVLRGWVKCRDGRLYHRVVAELAMEAWDRRKRDRDRKARFRSKLDADRRGPGDGPDGSGDEDATRTERGGDADGTRTDHAGDADTPPAERGRDADVRVPERGKGGSGTADRTGQDRTGNIIDSPLPPTRRAGGVKDSTSPEEPSGKPPGWKGQWRGLRTNGTNPRAAAEAEVKPKARAQDPDHPLWQKLKARGVTPPDFRAWIAPLAQVPAVNGKTVFVAPSRFIADRVRADWAEHLAAATGGPIEVRGPAEAARG